MGEVPSDIFRSGSRFDGARCMEDEPQRCASTVRVLRGSVTFGEKEHFVKFALGAVFVDFRSEEHTSELQSLMRISYAVFCLKKKKRQSNYTETDDDHTPIQDLHIQSKT